MKKSDIAEIFNRFHKKNPTPKVELNYKNNFTLAVAVLLSAQTTDIAVNKATKKLFEIADTPEKMFKLGVENLVQHIKTIGLYNSKAKHVIALSNILIKKYNSEIPKTQEELSSLPGIGIKTANVILNTAFGMPYIAVDTHVFRVSNRIGLVNTKTPKQTEKELEQIIPDEFKKNLSNWLVLHGRYICKAKKPSCTNCFISDLCEYRGAVATKAP